MDYRDGILNNVLNYSSSKPKIKKSKSMKPSEVLLKEIESNGFKMDQLEKVLKERGNQLIVSGAGSGKTTSLIFKVLYDLKTGVSTRLVEVNGNNVRVPDRIWVCTFLKSGADELRQSMIKWQYKLGCPDVAKAVTFSTLHAEFKRVLNSMGLSTNIISDSENSKLLKKIVGGYCTGTVAGKSLNSEIYRDLESALTYTRNRLDEKRYLRPIYDDLGLTSSIIDAILRDWKAARRGNDLFDFEDLQELLYKECYEKNNQDVISTLQDRYNYLYIDEFQDTSQIQYALLKIYGAGAKQILAIGDDDQTIYSWRGSYNGIITRLFAEDFLPVKNELSINYRCPKNILNAVKTSIELNEDRLEKKLSSFRDGGTVVSSVYPNYMTMVNGLCEYIRRDVKDGKSVAVLCRVNSDGLLPALTLDKIGGFEFSISGDGMTLDSYIGRCVIGICKLFTERSTPDVKRSLGMLTWDSYCINSLMKVCKSNKISFWEIDSKDLSYSCPEIANRLLTWRGYREDLGDLGALKMVLQDYRTSVFVKDTQFNNVINATIQSIELLLEYFKFNSVEDFIYELEDINDRLKARKGKHNRTLVRIATVHEFKGKEADSVYVWNDSDGVYPHSNCDIYDKEELEEERRIHYIACTRAKERLTLMSLSGRQGMFMEEMDLLKAIKEPSSVSGSFKASTYITQKYEEESGLQKFEDTCTVVDPDENIFWGVE